ncbi:SDR family NAD(P)-dependent oxidoreductase [Micromonospora sp. NPDC047707]|uniref:SDR family NAD(P)-dependent oxidoreductase n=1 Tax=Micromonospora sp. NPDC047707 TaxID=3154498 RepID=UPI003451D037
MVRHRHRTVVVTGASSGIGRACALRFARPDTALVLVSRDPAGLETLAAVCHDRGGQVLVAPADVSDAAAVEDVARRAVARFGRIDVWVNNAGVNLYGWVEECPDELWRRVVQVNLFGTYHGVRAVLPWFREQGHGVLINVSALLGHAGTPQQSAYAASKHGIRALSESVRQEVRDVDGISVCTILPGPVDTPLFRHAANWTGRRAVAPRHRVEADRVAKAVLRCARRPRPELPVSGATWPGALVTRLVPGLVTRFGAAAVERPVLADEPADWTAGNLFESAASTAGVPDGRRGERVTDRRRSGLARTATGLVIAGGGLAGAAAVWAGNRGGRA